MTKSIQLSKLLPDPIDERDYLFEPDYNVTLPESVNLRERIGRRLDQSIIGSCTAQTAANGGEMFVPSLKLSPRFNYYTSRELLGLQYLQGDPGSTARMALRAANKLGIPREELCPYDVSAMNVRPSQAAYDDALNYRIGEYRRIKITDFDDVIFQIKYALAKGWPVAIGLQVGEKLRNLQPGELYGFVHPTQNPYWGNHEMLIFGYGKTPEGMPYWDVENSWGPAWCDDGCLKMLATVVAVDGIDLWVIQGFASVDRAGEDRTVPKPIPPIPEPPEPEPEPEPIPDPAPDPQPEPETKSSGSSALIAGVAIILIAIVTKAAGLW